MKTTKLLTLLTASIIALSIISCSKGENGTNGANGATGPAGPAGAQGATGATGATGSQGAKGDTGAQGNANVTGQTFTTTTSSSWTYTSPNYLYTFTVTALDYDILSNGAVLVYMSTNSGVNWTALPFTLYGTTSDYLAGFYTGLNSVTITWAYNSTFSSGSNPNSVYGGNIEWNVVCIAPATLRAHPHTNFNNPAEVMQLPEVQAYLHKK